MIYIENRQNKIQENKELEKLLEDVCAFALKMEEVECKCQISVLFVDNDEIKEINQETRNINKETDVLSFPMLHYPKGKVFKDTYKGEKFHPMYLDCEELVLGDIVLSLEKALEQSKEYCHSFKREVSYLAVHSILHLLGYDHMIEEEKVIMRKREEEILSLLSINRE